MLLTTWYRVDNLWTIMTGERSRYSECDSPQKLEYPSHPYAPELCDSIATMPAGFRTLALQRTLSIRMLGILAHLSRVVQHVNHALQRIATADEIMFLLSYKPHLIVQDTYACLKSCRLSGSKMEISLCYSLVAFKWSVMNQGCLSPIYPELVRSLLGSLEELKPRLHEEECYVWMSMVAIGHSYNIQSFSERGNRLLESILNKYTFAKDWTKFKAVLGRFFWYEPLGQEWEGCWKKCTVQTSAKHKAPQRAHITQ